MNEWRVVCRHCKIDRIVVVDEYDKPSTMCPVCERSRATVLIPERSDPAMRALVQRSIRFVDVPSETLVAAEVETSPAPQLAMDRRLARMEELNSRRVVGPGLARALGRPEPVHPIGPPAPVAPPEHPQPPEDKGKPKGR